VGIDELVVASTERATTVEASSPCAGTVRIATVEHAFAALAGLGVYEGVAIAVDGPEMPLLDGGAAAWCDAIERLHPPRAAAPRLAVAREGVVRVGSSRYAFAPGDGVEVAVRVELDDGRLRPDARWAGDAEDFRTRVAPARTFARLRDVEELARRGLARHVDPACVVVIAPDRVHSADRPFAPDEPARHKLLDLVGDCYLFGGPPRGRLHAVRPGHSANVRALAEAMRRGLLAAR